jgi:YebC/PmpR family DNA-binding regulatory protein
MAGHSKWSKIKRKKAANDRKRGKKFTKLIREITVAARDGGGDPDFNPRLRLAIDTAKAEDMPQDNIDRAVKRGTGELEGVNYEEATYEGYGPGGVALFIEALTDNMNRTVSDIRHVLEKHGGNLAKSGSVAWQFERKGRVYVNADRYEEEATMLAAIEAGAEDFEAADDEYAVTTDVGGFHAVQDALKAQGIEFKEAEFVMIPNATVPVSGGEAEKLLRILDALDDLDDVQNVHSNADIDDAVVESEVGA